MNVPMVTGELESSFSVTHWFEDFKHHDDLRFTCNRRDIISPCDVEPIIREAEKADKREQPRLDRRIKSGGWVLNWCCFGAQSAAPFQLVYDTSNVHSRGPRWYVEFFTDHRSPLTDNLITYFLSICSWVAPSGWNPALLFTANTAAETTNLAKVIGARCRCGYHIADVNADPEATKINEMYMRCGVRFIRTVKATISEKVSRFSLIVGFSSQLRLWMFQRVYGRAWQWKNVFISSRETMKEAEADR